MMASVLKTSGYKTGLFTSPYIFRFNERMQINGKQIDDEVRALIAKARAMAEQVIEEHRDGLVQLAELLLEREVVFTEDVENIFGKRKGKANDEAQKAEAAEEPEVVAAEA